MECPDSTRTPVFPDGGSVGRLLDKSSSAGRAHEAPGLQEVKDARVGPSGGSGGLQPQVAVASAGRTRAPCRPRPRLHQTVAGLCSRGRIASKFTITIYRSNLTKSLKISCPQLFRRACTSSPPSESPPRLIGDKPRFSASAPVSGSAGRGTDIAGPRDRRRVGASLLPTIEPLVEEVACLTWWTGGFLQCRQGARFSVNPLI